MVEANLPVVFLSSLVTLFYGILLFVVLIANIKTLTSRVFSIFLLSGLSWGIFTILAAGKINTANAEYFANLFLNIIGLFPFVVSYFFFCLVYLKKNYLPWLLYLIPTYFVVSFMMAIQWFTVVQPEPFPGGFGFHHRFAEGPYLFVPLLWGASYIGPLFFYLIRDLIKRKGDKIHQQKVKLLLIATTIGTLASMIFNGNPNFWEYPVEIIGHLFVAVFLTYAVLKFELVDVTTKLRNIIVDLIFTAILATVYLGLLLAIQLLFRINTISWPTLILAIFIASLSQPFKQRLLKFVDITFYATRYDYRETIDKFAKSAGEILNLKELSSSITKTIKETFGSKEVYLYILNGYYYHCLSSSPNPFFLSHSNFVKYLTAKKRTISWDEDSRELATFAEIKELGSELIIPLMSGEELIGILFIGKSLSSDAYTRDDKSILYTLASSTAISLKNALLYEQVIEKNSAIQKLLQHERELTESKDQFIAIASHYLRTPLTTIKGFLYMLLNSKLTESESKNYLARVFNEQKRLASLVEDIISISSLEKGELKLYKETTPLSKIIKSVVDDYSALATEKGLVLKADIKHDISLQIDQQKLTQAVSNLVNNAIKFTSVGSVSILVDFDVNTVQICIQDTGIGIEDEQIGQLFQKFHRATSVRTYNYEGSGLGLYITKLIVDAHHGKITVSSKLGVGSSFCIYIPLHSTEVV